MTKDAEAFQEQCEYMEEILRMTGKEALFIAMSDKRPLIARAAANRLKELEELKKLTKIVDE